MDRQLQTNIQTAHSQTANLQWDNQLSMQMDSQYAVRQTDSPQLGRLMQMDIQFAD